MGTTAANVFSTQSRSVREKVRAVPDPMASYVPPEKEWVLRLRSTESVREQLEAAVEIWKALAESRGDDPSKIDISYFVRAQIMGGLTQTFEDVGGYPKTKEALEVVKENIRKKLKKR